MSAVAYETSGPPAVISMALEPRSPGPLKANPTRPRLAETILALPSSDIGWSMISDPTTTAISAAG
jgi:hypothetical protein